MSKSKKQLKKDLKYLKKHLDDDDIEWCNLVRKKIDTVIELQAKYDMECG